MLRRTFAKTLLFSCAIPCWPFKSIKQKLSNSELIAKWLREKRTFSITCDDGEKFNIIPSRYKTYSKLNARGPLEFQDKDRDIENDYICKRCGQKFTNARQHRLCDCTNKSTHWVRLNLKKIK